MKKQIVRVLTGLIMLIVSMTALVNTGVALREILDAGNVMQHLLHVICMSITVVITFGMAVLSGTLFFDWREFVFGEGEDDHSKMFNDCVPDAPVSDGTRFFQLPYDWQEDVWLRLPYDWAIDDDELK